MFRTPQKKTLGNPLRRVKQTVGILMFLSVVCYTVDIWYVLIIILVGLFSDLGPKAKCSVAHGVFMIP